MSTPRDRVNTVSVKREQITISKDLLDEMGVKKTDTFHIARAKRSKKVEKGAIILTPTEPKLRPWTDEEWRAAEAEADEDIRLGRVSKIYTSGEELIADLHRKARAWKQRNPK